MRYCLFGLRDANVNQWCTCFCTGSVLVEGRLSLAGLWFTLILRSDDRSANCHVFQVAWTQSVKLIPWTSKCSQPVTLTTPSAPLLRARAILEWRFPKSAIIFRNSNFEQFNPGIEQIPTLLGTGNAQTWRLEGFVCSGANADHLWLW